MTDNYTESTNDKIIKQFYGITGPLDEYRLSVVSRLGNKAFMFISLYIFFSGPIFLFADRFLPDYMFLISIIANLIVVLGTGTTVWVSSLKAGLLEEESTQRNAQTAIRSSVKSGMVSSIVFGVIMHFWNALTLYDDAPNTLSYVDALTRPQAIGGSLAEAIIFGLLFGFSIYFSNRPVADRDTKS